MRRKKTSEFYISSEKVPALEKERTFEVYVKTPIDIKRKKFCFVEVDEKRYLADIITGSLYSPMTGYCMSTNQLKLVGGIHE